jgi:hypothetical protein
MDDIFNCFSPVMACSERCILLIVLYLYRKKCLPFKRIRLLGRVRTTKMTGVWKGLEKKSEERREQKR